MNIYPTKIERKPDDELLIEWSDGRSQEIRISELRDRCPCATCREKRTAAEKQASMELLPVISHAETLPPRILSMKPVGNYAYNIAFADGCDTGIFTFEFLRKVGVADESQ